MTPRDVAIATAIAVVCIIALICHKWRLREADVVGYWRPANPDGFTGGEFQLELAPGGGLRAHGRETAGEESAARPARVGFLRRVCVGGRCGVLDLSGRHLRWGGGRRWVREGVFDCGSCA